MQSAADIPLLCHLLLLDNVVPKFPYALLEYVLEIILHIHQLAREVDLLKSVPWQV